MMEELGEENTREEKVGMLDLGDLDENFCLL
jgi:hypothetical protein